MVKYRFQQKKHTLIKTILPLEDTGKNSFYHWVEYNRQLTHIEITLTENIPLLVEYFYHFQPQFSLLQHQICPLSPESVFHFFLLLFLQKEHTEHSTFRVFLQT